MLNIVQFIDALNAQGGAERLIVIFAEALQHFDARLTVVTLRENDPDMQRQVEAMGGSVVAFPARRVTDPLRFLRMLRYLRSVEIDLIHTHLTGATILGASLGRLLSIPVVTSLHNTKTKNSHKLQGPLENWHLLHSVQKLIAVGWETAKAQRRHLPQRSISVIPTLPTSSPNRRPRHNASADA